MPNNNALETARGRAKQMGLPYDGALTPQEAYDVLQRTPGAKLVDVRTRAELDCKRAILPQETVAREALFTIARAARRQPLP